MWAPVRLLSDEEATNLEHAIETSPVDNVPFKQNAESSFSDIATLTCTRLAETCLRQPGHQWVQPFVFA